MRKILFREICKKVVLSILAILGLALIYLLVVYVIDGKIEGSTAGGYLVSLVITAKVFTNFSVRDVFYIIPFSRRDRENFVKVNLFSTCITLSLCLGIGECILKTSEILAGNQQKQMNILAILFAVVLIFLVTYTMMYADYLEKKGSGHIVTVIFSAVAQIILIRIVISSGEIDWNRYGVIFAILVWSCCLFNYWLTRRFYQDMIRFFADYESSRQVLKEKVKV